MAESRRPARGKAGGKKVGGKAAKKARAPAASPLGGLTEALLAVSTWLSAEQVAFAVIGGVAASLHGRPRVTKDVDLVVHVDDGSWAALLRGAARHGVRPRVADALVFARITRVLLLVHEPSGIEIDVSCAMLPFEHELIARARTRTIGKLRLPLASAEDIVVMKALALRPRDVADIEGIVESVPNLDVARIRRAVAQLSAALEAEDHVTELDAILRRLGG